MSLVDEPKNDVVDIDEAHKAKSRKLVTNGESSIKLMGVDKHVKKDNVKGKEVKPILKTIPRTHPPLP